jgi:hypothetical protein
VPVLAIDLPVPAVLIGAEALVLVCGALIVAALVQEAVDGLLRWWFRRRRASR